MVLENLIDVVAESKQETECMTDLDDYRINQNKVIQQIDVLNAEAWELRDEDVAGARAKSEEIKCLLDSLEPEYTYYRGIISRSTLVAFLLFRQHNFKDAIEVALTAEKLCNEQSLIDLLPKLYGILGNGYMDLDVQSLGYQYLYRQLFLSEELNQLLQVASAKHDLALAYSSAGKIDVGISMLTEVSEILKPIDDEWFKVLTKMNLAMSYSNMGDFDKALALLQQCLAFAEQNSHDTAKLFVFSMYSHVYYDKGEYQQALHWLNKQICLSKILAVEDDYDFIFEAQILLKLKEYDQVERVLNQVMLKDNVDLEIKTEIYKIFAECYAQQEKYIESIEMYVNYSESNEVLAKKLGLKSLETSEAISDLESLRHEAEQAKTNNLLLQEKVTELDKLQNEYYQLSIHDSLTGIPNRRYITEFLTTTFAAAIRYQGGFGLALLDIDRFKLVNDNFSHQVGDTVLKQIAEILKNHVRQSDAVARFGGEEFILTFQEDSITDSVAFCERVRKSIEDYDWEIIAKDLKITASFGIASLVTVPSAKRFEDLISYADKKLYESKDKGRNCVSY